MIGHNYETLKITDRHSEVTKRDHLYKYLLNIFSAFHEHINCDIFLSSLSSVFCWYRSLIYINSHNLHRYKWAIWNILTHCLCRYLFNICSFKNTAKQNENEIIGIFFNVMILNWKFKTFNWSLMLIIVIFDVTITGRFDLLHFV